jgi:micrococcal nuclease
MKKTKKETDDKIKRAIKKTGGIMGLMFLAVMGMEGYKYYQTHQPKGIAVLGVIDGDTRIVEGKTRFRLRNIDAPEAELCGGAEAKKELEKLVKEKRIRIEEEIIDKWGRPMGLIYVDDVLINEKMIQSGWAKYHADQTTVADKLKKIGDENKKDKKGLYGKCWQTENKENPKCNIKGNIDPSNQNTKRYYWQGCVQYNTTIVELDRNEQWFCTRSEAEAAGYVASERCP